jgi:hypothetical protein
VDVITLLWIVQILSEVTSGDLSDLRTLNPAVTYGDQEEAEY